MHRIPLAVSLSAWLAVVLTAAAAGGDVVRDWNATLRAAIEADAATANPGWATRSLAMTHAAIYDAFQAVERTHAPFLVDLQAADASLEAAASEAAYEVILDCYPTQQPQLDVALAASLAAIPDTPAKSAGIALGHAIAAQYIDARSDDGADVMVPYLPTAGPGRWQPDPLHPQQQAWGPGWGQVAPFVLESSDQFPLPGVPALASQAYTDAFLQAADVGARDSASRTPEQTRIGLFWAYDRAGIGPPPVLFSRHLDEIAAQRGNTPQQNARLFALASVAMADAAIAAWDAKFVADFWRPVTAIRAADTDGNPDTDADPAWVPLGAPGPEPTAWTDDFTPPFPTYPSGHATMGGALYQALRIFYQTDAIDFELSSEELPPGDDTRAFASFGQAEYENAISRVYLGIHWLFDAEDGIQLGNEIADWIAARHFQPVPEPGAGALGGVAIASAALLRRARRRART